MAINNISFTGWQKLPQVQLDKLSKRECVGLGLAISQFKQKGKVYNGFDGIYLNITKNRENKFTEVCKGFKITPQKTEI